LLPLIFGFVTVVLWFWARLQYVSQFQPTRSGSDVGWVALPFHYTPVPLDIVGLLNVPVATFAHPLYGLVHDDKPAWKLLALLSAVVLQWAYVGLALEGRLVIHDAHSRRTLSVLGIMFGLFILAVMLMMYHVSIFYRFSVVVWSLCAVFHFAKMFRRSSLLLAK
ncbi:MAG: hypothetical protein AB7O65_04845, partial [Candidatus Korobacteraceae bacterium]